MLKAWIECHNYVERMFFTIRFTCVLKNMRLMHGLRNLHFTIP